MERITFNELPDSVIELHKKVDALIKIVNTKGNSTDDNDKLLTIEELLNYLPEKPAKQTVYGWINSRSIPYEKYTKRLYFRKSVIDAWLSRGRRV